MKYEIKRLSDLKNYNKDELTKLYIESFKNKMGAVSKDSNILEKIFINSFNPKYYYVCLDGEKIVGIAACSTHLERANSFTKKELIDLLGVIKGNLALFLINAMLAKPSAKSETEGYIESVATHKDYRGQGIATALFKHIHENTSYNRYILDVIHGNDNAKHLYEDLGYEVYKVETGIAYKIMKIKALYFMEYFKGNINQKAS